jgi:hypothetical protein
MNIRKAKALLLLEAFAVYSLCQNCLSFFNKNSEERSIKTAVSRKNGTDISGGEKILFLEESAKIEDGFSDQKYNYFDKITSVCVDAENNLYVADSGLHRIFKFNEYHKYLLSFGSIGQGPGEFLGTLRISIGNDGRLYVTDDGNWQLYIFSTLGKIFKQFSIEEFIYDVPLADSKGCSFLLSPSGLKLIDYYDASMRLKGSLIEYADHLIFSYENPPKRILINMHRPSINDIKKLLTREDELMVLSNNSQLVFHFDKNLKIIKKFKIEHPRFIADYRKRLKENAIKGGWLNCFGSFFLDNKENICFCYYNSSIEQPEIYRYGINGLFKDTLRIKAKRNMYSASANGQSIIVYHEEKLN